MKKIALALALISASIPSLAQAKEGEQTIDSFKINYPYKIEYSKELSDSTQKNINSEIEKNKSNVKSVAIYTTDPVCDLETVMISKITYGSKLDATAEGLAKAASNVFLDNFTTGKIILSSVENNNINGIDTANGINIVSDDVSFIYYDSFYAIDKKGINVLNISFLGRPESEKIGQKMKSCFDSIINTVGVVE